MSKKVTSAKPKKARAKKSQKTKVTKRAKTSQVSVKKAPKKAGERPAKPKKKRFSKKELEKIRQILIEEKKRILEHLRNLGSLSATDGTFRTADELPHHSMHMAEFASDNQAIDAAIELRNIEERQLAEIEEALIRLDGGRFGICEVCGQNITKARLMALPWTRFCRECKEKMELGEI